MSSAYEHLLRPVVISPETMGLLSKAELEMARADETVSRHPLSAAICRQLLRLEAATSAMVDGSKVSYSALARMEVYAATSPRAEGTLRALFRRAEELGVHDPAGHVSAFSYMNAIDWISKNVKSAQILEASIFDEIYLRYNENEVNRVRASREGTPQSTEPHTSYGKTIDRMRSDKIASYIEFLNSELFLPSAQAEISHAMVQSIDLGQHRMDGYERAFSHIILYRRGLLTGSVAPLAVGPAIDVNRHATSIYENMGALSNTRRDDTVSQFDFNSTAFCTVSSARVMNACASALETFNERWKAKLGGEGTKKTQELLLKQFLKWGYLTIDLAAKETGRSFSTISTAMRQLEDAGIVQEVGHVNKSRLYSAHDVVDFFDGLIARTTSRTDETRDEVLARIERSATARI